MHLNRGLLSAFCRRQNDKRCLFGSTVLTTNEETYFLKDIHKVCRALRLYRLV
jgi:hypothetical protein